MEMYNQDEKGLWESIYDTLELYGRHDIDDDFACFEFWTDTAGQDVVVEFDYDGTGRDFIEKFCEHAENYDVDSEVELYVGMRGQHGVPSSVKTILADCQEAKDTLMEIAEDLKHFI